MGLHLMIVFVIYRTYLVNGQIEFINILDITVVISLSIDTIITLCIGSRKQLLQRLVT